MNVNDLPDIVNNKDLTQHFLYSYLHQSKIGPSNKLKTMFADDLIFDRSRKSIFTQYQEFGYICDKYVSIDMGSYQGSDSSYIDIFSYEGEINAYSFIPWYATDFSVEMTPNNKSIQLGTTRTINSISWKNNGSQERLRFYENDPDNPIQSEEISMLSCKISYVLNDTETIIYNTPQNNIGDITVNLTSTTICANEPGKLKFELEISCSECADIVSRQVIDGYEIANYFVVSKTKNTNDFENIKEKLLNNDTSVIENQQVKVLTNDIRKHTNENPILCVNGYNVFYFVGIPSRIHNDDVLYGTLNNGSAQEFVKLDITNENTIRTLIGGDYYEDYSFYLATNHSWNGSQLTFNNFHHI